MKFILGRRIRASLSLAARATILVGGGLLATAEVAFSAPGNLDSTFGSGGVLYHESQRCTGSPCSPYVRNSMNGASVRASDRHVVVVGAATEVVVSSGVDDTILNRQSDLVSAARIDENGALAVSFQSPNPPGFGEPGVGEYAVQFNDGTLGAISSTSSVLFAVATTPSGEAGPFAVGVGTSDTFFDQGTDSEEFLFASFQSDGAVDTTFGSEGFVIVPTLSTENPTPSTKLTAAYDVVRRANGYFLAAGIGKGDVALVQVRDDGSFDPAFGTDGVLQSAAFGASYGALSVAEDNAGRIVLVASNIVDDSVAISSEDLVVARFLDDGLDTSFNGTGFVRVSGGLFGIGTIDTIDVDVDEDNRVVVSSGTLGTVVARYLEDGSIDASFGTAGSITLANGVARSIAVDERNRIYLAGAGGANSGGADQVWVARLDDGGALDTSFAATGESFIDIPEGDRESAFDIALEGNGNHVVIVGGVEDLSSNTFYDTGWFVIRMIGGPFCFDGLIGPGETDTDGDLVEDICDNCVSICNPDQSDIDGDCSGDVAGGEECGDVCDACPAHREDEQPPECNTAYYNTEGYDCCFPVDSAAQSTDPICTGSAVSPIIVEVGDGELPAGSLWGEGNPPGGAILKIPAATADGLTFSITAKGKGAADAAAEGDYFTRHAAGRFVGRYKFAPSMTFAAPAEPITVCIKWVDDNDDGTLDALAGAGTFPADGMPYQYRIGEASLQLWKADPATNLGGIPGGACRNKACGGIGPDGTPSDWGAASNVRNDDPSLRLCCSRPENRWCYETRTFSQYGLAPQCSLGFDKAQLKYKLKNGKLVFKGSFRLGDGLEQDVAETFKPAETGAEVQIFDQDDNLLERITLPGVPFSSSSPGWKSNRAGDVFTYIDKNKSSTIKKVQLKRKDRTDPSKLDVKVLTNDLGLTENQLAGTISLQFRLLDENPGHCGVTDFTQASGGFCAPNRNGTVLTCRQ